MDRLQYFEDGHRYELDGLPIPSNTQTLKAEGLINDAFYTPDGRDRGINVHAACWFLCEGNLDWKSVHEEEVGYVKGFERFLKETGFRIDFNELPVWGSPGFGTRLDVMGVGEFQINQVFTQRRVIIDIKTGSVPAWVELQLAGQMLAVKERVEAQDEAWTQHLDYVNGHPYPELRFALQLNKNGKYRLKEFTDPTAEEVFRGLVHAYNWKVRTGFLKEK